MVKRTLRWSLVALWCGVIFYLSQQDGAESGETSEMLRRLLAFLGLDATVAFGGLTSFVLRKGAHFMEYFILCLLVFNACRNTVNFARSLLVSFLFTAIYAISDELHQYFIPGRACALQDMVIDSAGGGLGILVIWSVHRACAVRAGKK